MRASRNIAQVLRQRRRRIQALLARLSELGTDGYPPEVQRRLKILNAVAYIIAASTLDAPMMRAGMPSSSNRRFTAMVVVQRTGATSSCR